MCAAKRSKNVNTGNVYCSALSKMTLSVQTEILFRAGL